MQAHGIGAPCTLATFGSVPHKGSNLGSNWNSGTFMIATLIRKLERLGTLSAEERRLFDTLPLPLSTIGAHETLVREGEQPTECRLIVDGLVCRHKTMPDGRRQIVSFHIPGDLVDLTSLLMGRMDHGIATLTPVTVAALPHTILRDWIQHHPNIATLLWQDTLVDASVFREWVLNVGRRSTPQRVAHLLCELVTRMRAAGLVQGQTCDLPVTALDLADATGLSLVLVNRVLQELRAAKLIDLGDGVVSVLDTAGLKGIGGFDPAYLHQLAVAA